MKVCSCCKVSKDESEFYKNNQRKDGLSNNCKICQNEIFKKWRIKNKDRYNKMQREKRTSEKTKEYRETFKNKHGKVKSKYKTIRSKESKNRMKFYQNNKDNLIERQHEYYENNKEKIHDNQKIYKVIHLDQQNAHNRMKTLKRKGILKQPTVCSVVGCDLDSPLQYFYLDYNPLRIVPMCRCHIRRINGAKKRKDDYEYQLKRELIIDC